MVQHKRQDVFLISIIARFLAELKLQAELDKKIMDWVGGERWAGI